MELNDFINSEKAKKKRDELFVLLEDLNVWEGAYLLSNVFCCLLGMTHLQGHMAAAESIFKTHNLAMKETWEKIKRGQYKP